MWGPTGEARFLPVAHRTESNNIISLSIPASGAAGTPYILLSYGASFNSMDTHNHSHVLLLSILSSLFSNLVCKLLFLPDSQRPLNCQILAFYQYTDT